MLDSEGVTLFADMEVEDSCRHAGIYLAVPPSRREMMGLGDPTDSAFFPETVVACFEQFRDDGVAVFRQSKGLRR